MFRSDMSALISDSDLENIPAVSLNGGDFMLTGTHQKAGERRKTTSVLHMVLGNL